jgi:hypothetical protein
LDHGADVTVADENGETPLDIAERLRTKSVIELLKGDLKTSPSL